MSIAKKAGSMSVAVLMSRILGLVREQVFAFFFGASVVADAFWVAFRIPNLFRDLFAEGALSSSFVKVLSSQKSDTAARDLTLRAARALTVILAVVLILLFVGSEWIVWQLAGDFQKIEGKFELTVDLTRLLTPFLFFASIAALATGLLNSRGLFFLPAMAPAVFNFSSFAIGGALAWWWRSDPAWAISGFAIGTLLGGFLMWLVQWPWLLRFQVLPWAGVVSVFSMQKLKEAFQDKEVREMFRLMGPAVIGIAAVQINVLVNTVFATRLETGSVTWLNFAYRFLHLPLGLVGVSLSVAALPTLARLIRDGKREEFSRRFEDAFGWGTVVGTGAMGGLLVLAPAIISLIYQHGAFQERDTIMTSFALQFYALGLLGFIWQKLMVSAFYALGSVRIPAFTSLLSVGLNFLGAYLLTPYFAHGGLALSTAISVLIQAGILFAVLHFRRQIHLGWTFFRDFMASTIGAGIFFLYFLFFDGDLLMTRQQKGLSEFVVEFFVTATLLGVAYIGVSLWVSGRHRVFLRLNNS